MVSPSPFSTNIVLKYCQLYVLILGYESKLLLSNIQILFIYYINYNAIDLLQNAR